MNLLVTITWPEGRADAPPGRRRSLRFDSQQLRIGGAEGADVALPGVTGGELVLTPTPEGGFALALPADAPAARLNDEALAPATTQPLRNADELAIAGYLVRFTVIFPRAGQGYKVGLLPILSFSLIALILALELGIWVWLPRAATARSRWGLEISRQRMYMTLDGLRSDIRRQKKNEDPRTKATCDLIGDELDQLGVYIRRYESDLSGAQVAQIFADLMKLQATMRDVTENSLYPPPSQLQLEPALQHLLKPEAVSP